VVLKVLTRFQLKISNPLLRTRLPSLALIYRRSLYTRFLDLAPLQIHLLSHSLENLSLGSTHEQSAANARKLTFESDSP
jgi:hypothetical protein